MKDAVMVDVDDGAKKAKNKNKAAGPAPGPELALSETAIAGEEDDPLATEEWESEEELEFMKRWIKKGRDIGEEHGKGRGGNGSLMEELMPDFMEVMPVLATSSLEKQEARLQHYQDLEAAKHTKRRGKVIELLIKFVKYSIRQKKKRLSVHEAEAQAEMDAEAAETAAAQPEGEVTKASAEGEDGAEVASDEKGEQAEEEEEGVDETLHIRLSSIGEQDTCVKLLEAEITFEQLEENLDGGFKKMCKRAGITNYKKLKEVVERMCDQKLANSINEEAEE